MVSKIYGESAISERHRHRYEVNPHFFASLEEAGLLVTGRSPDGKLAEMVELPTHPYFVACQFHPEFKSRPLEPHPLFAAFIRGAVEYRLSSTSQDRKSSVGGTAKKDPRRPPGGSQDGPERAQDGFQKSVGRLEGTSRDEKTEIALRPKRERDFRGSDGPENTPKLA